MRTQNQIKKMLALTVNGTGILRIFGEEGDEGMDSIFEAYA